MKGENSKINLRLGDTSMSASLGTYYIDMTPAEIHYTDNIWGGKFDVNGVPMIPDENGNQYYSSVNIAQYGFILHKKYLEKNDKNSLDKLEACLKVLERTKTESAKHVVWLENSDSQKYKLKAPWPSAMSQGEVISFYLRMYQIKKNDKYLKTAEKAFEFLKLPYNEGGVKRYDKEGYLWLEEYPSKEPSFVLNGFIYCVFGIFDLYRVTKNKEVKEVLDKCIYTLKMNLHRFDAGYWSYYDLLKKELVKYYYQKNVHVPQLLVLFELTQEPVFKTYAKRWQSQLNPYSFGLVQIMYRIKPRLDLLKKIIFR